MAREGLWQVLGMYGIGESICFSAHRSGGSVRQSGQRGLVASAGDVWNEGKYQLAY